MTDLRVPGADVAELFRAAARELLPVVIDLGPEQARFSSFVGAVADAGGGYAVLEPVADALPDVANRAIRITPASNASWYVIAHRIERAGTRAARVALTQAHVFESEPEASTVAVPATELLVLVVPGGLHGSSAYVFPIQRIGPETCEIRSSVALPAGERLECVEIVGDRRLLRRAAAQVLETVPCYLPDGSQSFSCRLSLSEEAAVDRERQHDLVTEPAEVHRALDLAGMLRCEGWYEAPGWGRGRLDFVEVRKSDARVELAFSPQGEPLTGQRVRIGFELFAISYEIDVRILSSGNGQLVTSLPLILRRRRRHRRDDRVQIPPADRVELSFRNAVTGAVQTHAVAEVSFFSISFECPATSTVWRSLPLEQAQISWRNRLVHLGDLTVEEHALDRTSGKMRCLATIAESRITDDPDMICLLATLAHPYIRTHDGNDFDALHRTYLKAGLFGPHMARNLAPIVPQMSQVWRRLHADAADVVRTFVHGPDEAPDAAVTIMRAWEHGWVLQHFVDTSSEITGATGKLQHAYLDHLVPRPDGRFLVFFVKTDNRIMNAYVRRFFASTGTPDAVTRSVVELWSRPADATLGAQRTPAERGLSLRNCSNEDHLVVGRAAQRCFGSYGAGALSMIPGEMELPDTHDRFAAAGLDRSRDCRAIARGDTLVYAMLEERSTPGMNLTWMLNASWILPAHPELDQDGSALDAALQAIVERPAQSATGERFLNLPEGLDPERLGAWGFSKEASCYLYVLTRAGLHRFFHYAAGRYGELDALVMRRRRRRAKGTEGHEPD